MKNRTFILCIFICLCFCSLQAQQNLLLPVKNHGKWGYCDTLGIVQIPLQFELAGIFFDNGLAPVKLNGSSYLINRQGEIITKDLCKEIKVIGNKIFACYNGTDWKLFGPNLSAAPPYIIKAIEPAFNNWVIHTPNGAGLIDDKASTLIEPTYEYISETEEQGYYIIYKDSLMGIAGPTGEIIIQPKYQFSSFSKPGIIIYSFYEKMGIMSLNGKVKTDTLYSDFKTNENDPFVMLIDQSNVTSVNINTGKKFICDSTIRINFFDKDYMMVYLKDGLNLLNENMEYVFPEQYETIRREEGGFVVSKNNLFGYTDSSGKIIHPTQYDYISSVVNKTAISSLKKLNGIIHTSGDVIAKPMYQKAEIYSSTAKVYTENSVITIEFDVNGNIIDRSEFNNFKTITIGGFRDVRKPTQTSETIAPSVWFYQPSVMKWGLNSPTGELLLLPQFDVVDTWNDTYTKVGVYRESGVSIGNHTLLSRYTWGLVNHKTGEIIYKPAYIDIHIDHSGGKKTIILVDNGFNYYMKDSVGKKLYGPFSWIGKSNGTTRPVAEGGSLKKYHIDTTYTKLGTLNQYIYDNFSNNAFWQISNSARTYTGDIVLEKASYYLWDEKNQGIDKTKRYDYISSYMNGFARMDIVPGRKFGIIDTAGNIIVPCEYDNIEILRSGHSVFFLKYNKTQTYGFLKSNGSWAFEKKFAGDGSFSDGMAFMGRNQKGQIICVDSTGNIQELDNINRHGYFSEGLVPIKEKKKWYYADKNFKLALEDEAWDWAGQFSCGRAPIKIGVIYHYINDYGYKVSEKTFEKADEFEDGRALVKENHKWGVINTSCEYIIKPKFSMMKYKPEDSLYHCRTEDGWALYNMDGSLMVKKRIQYMRPFINGFAYATLSNDKRVLLKRNGSYLEAPKNMYMQSVQGEFVTVFLDDGKMHLADTNFKVFKLKNTFTNFRYGSDGIIFGKLKGEGWAALDNQGNIISKISGIPKSGFHEGYAIVMVGNGQRMYINRKGEQAFGMFFSSAYPFENGMARVYTGKGWGIVDASGNFIVYPKYKYISPFKNGYASVQTESLISISDSKNKPLVEGEYDAVVLEPFGLFRIESADKCGWISKQGRIIWNPTN